jgi:hypothetical protein
VTFEDDTKKPGHLGGEDRLVVGCGEPDFASVDGWRSV